MTQMARYLRLGACLFLTLAMATACADASSGAPPSSPDAPTPSSDAPSTPAGVGTEEAWLAALRVETDPEALDADTAALKEILGGALIVSPAQCFQGLPADVDASAYVLGVQTSTQKEMVDLVAEIEREPLFEAQVTVMCTD